MPILPPPLFFSRSTPPAPTVSSKQRRQTAAASGLSPPSPSTSLFFKSTFDLSSPFPRSSIFHHQPSPHRLEPSLQRLWSSSKGPLQLSFLLRTTSKETTTSSEKSNLPTPMSDPSTTQTITASSTSREYWLFLPLYFATEMPWKAAGRRRKNKKEIESLSRSFLTF